MGTIVTIETIRAGTEEVIGRAFTWFREVESRCSRFRDESELSGLRHTIGRPIAVSPIVFEALRFASAVARETHGAFDPTVQSPGGGTYDDVEIDEEARTVTLRRPVTLDLGAVAKGLAVDAAARELKPTGDFAIDAGGDLFLGGRNKNGTAWSVGIRHPRVAGEILETIRVSDRAVCTSGDYERGPHVIDPRSQRPAPAVASATVIAPSAMLADALGTAAFVLGPEEGIALLSSHGLHGLIVTPALQRFETPGWPGS